jgi:hypothetical protein
MDDSLKPALRRARLRLNAVIVAHRALAWAAPAAVASGLAVAGLHALGAEAAGLALWAASVLACAAIGAWRAWRSRVDDAGAARWLDERLGDEELLSAALVCLGRDAAGRFDEAIVAGAQALIPRASALRASPRPLVKRAAIAAAACAIGAYLVFLSSPLSGSQAGTRARGQGGSVAAAEVSAAEESAASALDSGGGAAAAAFAQSLFPSDRRQATLAERALREGRLDDLKDMLKAANLEYESKLSRPVGEAERKKLASERERIQATARAIDTRMLGAGAGFGRAPGERGQGQGQGREGGGPDSEALAAESPGAEGPEAGKPGEKGGAESAERGQGDRGGNEGRPGGPGGLPGSGGGSGGDLPGVGSGGSGRASRGGSGYGSGEGAGEGRGPGEPAASAERLVIEPSKKASFFEVVLPGQESSRPIASLVPDSRRSAESAMSREGVPLEYEDFVRSYFMSLSQGHGPQQGVADE